MEFIVAEPRFELDGLKNPPANFAAARSRRKYLYILTDRPDWVVPEFANTVDGVLSDVESMPDSKISESAFFVYWSRAEYCLRPLRRINACGGLYYSPSVGSQVNFMAVSAYAITTYNEMTRVLGKRPFMNVETNMQIAQGVEITRDVPGDHVEIGVFSGTSALMALIHMRNLGIRRRSWLLDTYGGFNYQNSVKSSDAIWSGTHFGGPSADQIRALTANLGQEVNVVVNDISADPLPEMITQIALANIDVDLYEGVLLGLNKVAPLMAHRGVIMLEDPTSLPTLYGAYVALNDFLEGPFGRDFVAVRGTTTYFLVCTRP
jgi:hypothetical protein